MQTVSYLKINAHLEPYSHYCKLHFELEVEKFENVDHKIVQKYKVRAHILFIVLSAMAIISIYYGQCLTRTIFNTYKNFQTLTLTRQYDRH